MHELLVEKDVAIPCATAARSCANVFRPAEAGDVSGDHDARARIRRTSTSSSGIRSPGSSVPEHGPHMHWETVNPEWWVPHGYVVIRCDTRGTGKSPGRAAAAVARRGGGLLRRGRVGRDAAVEQRQGGGDGHLVLRHERLARRRAATAAPGGDRAVGGRGRPLPRRRPPRRHLLERLHARLGQPRAQPSARRRRRPIRRRCRPRSTASCTSATIRTSPTCACRCCRPATGAAPACTCAATSRATSAPARAHKYLQIHVGDHVDPFYSLEGRLVQLRFLEQFLRGVDTGITREPPIRLAIRHDGERYRWRYENEWPLARTRVDRTAPRRGERRARDDASGGGEHRSATTPAPGAARDARDASRPRRSSTTRRSPGRSSSRLWVSSSSDDADLFAILRNLGRDGSEVTSTRAPCPAGSTIAAAYGWLRVSHRKLDPARSTPYRPFHTHDEIQKLQPGETVRGRDRDLADQRRARARPPPRARGRRQGRPAQLLPARPTRAIACGRARTRFTPAGSSTRTCCCRSFRHSWGRSSELSEFC